MTGFPPSSSDWCGSFSTNRAAKRVDEAEGAEKVYLWCCKNPNLIGLPFAPLQQTYNMWAIFSLLAALSAAVAITLSKAGLKKVDPSLGFAVQAVLILLVSWSVVFFQKKNDGVSQIDQRTWIYLVLAGIVTCLSSLFQFNALKLGDASMVTSIERLSLVFAIILAVFFLKEDYNWKIIVGAALMVGGAVLIGFSRKS